MRHLAEEMFWRQYGACRDKPQDWWYPERGDSTREAKEVCAVCPVMEACRTWGLKHEHMGIWGGLSERERRRLRKRAGIKFEHITSDPFAYDRPAAELEAPDPFEEIA